MDDRQNSYRLVCPDASISGARASARGRENYGGGLSESVLLPITRVAFLGARALPQIPDAPPG
jgi:hypothetical protein